MRFHASCVSGRGSCRAKNEDNFYFCGKINSMSDSSLTGYTFNGSEVFAVGVFDGMGGEQRGETASLLAATAFGKAAERITEEPTPESISAAFEDANTRICQKTAELRLKRMGTTAVAAVIAGYNALIANVGDSRAYLCRGRKVTQLSKDHTEKPAAPKWFGLVRKKQQKAPLIQHLGIFPDEQTIKPHFVSVKLQQGDRILLCSDGLSDVVPERLFTEITKAHRENPAGHLYDEAIKRKSDDNVTVIVVEVVE